MAGSTSATLQAASIRGALVAVIAGGVAWGTAYFSIDDSCPSATTRLVQRLEASGKNPGALRVAKLDGKEARAKCLKKVDEQQRGAILAGIGTFGTVFGIRGVGEGLVDRKRQRDGDVRPSDVQV